jgi:uncharacterized protein (DUF2062 family)
MIQGRKRRPSASKDTARALRDPQKPVFSRIFRGFSKNNLRVGTVGRAVAVLTL